MSENGTLDDRYLEWLYKQIGGSLRNRNPSRSHWKLAKQLYTKKFLWFVPNDDNRAIDGMELRFEFLDESGLDTGDSLWLMLECSMLEMLIGLSRRVAYQSYGSPDEWFWTMMGNIDVRKYTDDRYNRIVELEVNEALDIVIERTYEEDGTGGLFPLLNAQRDQTKIELWYQASAYLLEGSFVENGP